METREKVIVITGASKGLGKALALAFKREGATLILASHLGKELDTLAEKLSAYAFAAEVTDEKQVMQLAKFTVKKFGRIDVWINNAGIRIPHGPIEKLDSKRVHEMMEVNLFGVIYGSKAALTQMRRQHSGTIINILSTSALIGRAFSSVYCASKYAVAGFTKSLRQESGPDISVIEIYPGGMKTNLFDEDKPEDFDSYMDPNYVAEIIVENFKKATPEKELIIKRNK